MTGLQIVKVNLTVFQLLVSTLDLLPQFTTLSIPCLGLLLALVLEGLDVGWSGRVAVTGRQRLKPGAFKSRTRASECETIRTDKLNTMQRYIVPG